MTGQGQGKVEVEKTPEELEPNLHVGAAPVRSGELSGFGGREEPGRDSYFSVPGPEQVMLPAP